MKIERSMLKLFQLVANLQPTIIFMVKAEPEGEFDAFIPDTPEEVKEFRENVPLGQNPIGMKSLLARDKIYELTGLSIPGSIFKSETALYDLYPERLEPFPPK
jgi:hypothetical protein